MKHIEVCQGPEVHLTYRQIKQRTMFTETLQGLKMLGGLIWKS
jgi:hypothetical protein